MASPQRALTWIVAAVAVLALGLAWREQQSVNGLRKDVAALSASQSELGAPAPTVIVERERVVVHEPAPPATVSAPEPSPDTHPEPMSNEAHARSIAARFEGESKDTSWADRATADLERAFATTKLEGVALDHLECRATLCRAHARFESIEAERAAMNALFLGTQAPIQMGGVELTDMEEGPGGAMTAEMWIARGAPSEALNLAR